MTLEDIIKSEGIYGIVYDAIDKVSDSKDIFVIKEDKEIKEVKVRSFLNYAEEKVLSALKMVLLPLSVLDKKVCVLSSTELKKVILAKALLSHQRVLILSFFEKGFTFKELNYFKKFFRKLALKYHKCILVYTKDLSFFFELVDQIFLNQANGQFRVLDKNEMYDKKLLKEMQEPEIISFVQSLAKKGILFPQYTDVKEVLKAIYREVS